MVATAKPTPPVLQPVVRQFQQLGSKITNPIMQLGHILVFAGRAIAGVPIVLKSYRKEYTRLLSDVAWGNGSLVVGDSHHYGPTPDPFAAGEVDALILDELDRVLGLGGRRVVARWVGTYASCADRWRFTDAPDPVTRIVVVTAGCGASTAFGIAEETIDDLYGKTAA